MCGIAGILCFNDSTKSVESIYKMTQSLRHRGPDDEGYILFSEKPAPFCGDESLEKNLPNIKNHFHQNFNAAFGFRQLKIIDLSNRSHQPMCDESQRYWIVFNGEIYNYKEVREELKSLGYSFFSNSDTEVILKAYIQWKEKALHKFNGMFAFSIYDFKTQELFLARDRIGIKPLYYYQDTSTFLFGSSMNSIIQSKIYKPEIHWDGLWQNFRFSVAQNPSTCFEGIQVLEPGHFLKINRQKKSFYKSQYWEVPVNTQNHSLTLKDSIHLLEDSLQKSIQYRLISDVEVGSFMSGGIDSCLVTALTSKEQPNIKALTLGFRNEFDFNEIEEAKATAKLHQIEHIIHTTDAQELIDTVESSTIAYEEPYSHISLNFLLANMASKNSLKVILNGMGGDELFGGYDAFYKIPYWKQLKRFNNALGLIPSFHPKIKKGKELSNYESLGAFYSHYHTNFTDFEIERLFKNKTYHSDGLIESLYEKELNFSDEFEAISFFHLKSYIGNHQMRALDKTLMSFSTEGRFPLLDHQFIEACYRIPNKYKIRNGVQKYLLKKIAKKHLARKTMKMKKKGLSVPQKMLKDRVLKEFIFDSINQLKKRHIFHNDTIDQILSSNDSVKTWQLVSTELWIQNFIDNNA